jgi:hypothetical protein
MTTPAMEERIMELMPEDAKAALLLLARQLPYEVGPSTGSRAGSPDTPGPLPAQGTGIDRA